MLVVLLIKLQVILNICVQAVSNDILDAIGLSVSATFSDAKTASPLADCRGKDGKCQAAPSLSPEWSRSTSTSQCNTCLLVCFTCEYHTTSHLLFKLYPTALGILRNHCILSQCSNLETLSRECRRALVAAMQPTQHWTNHQR